MTSRRRMLVIAAVARESAASRSRLEPLERGDAGRAPTAPGLFPSVSGVEVRVAHCGIGPTCAAAFVQRLGGDAAEFDAVRIVGLCGALDPAVEPGRRLVFSEIALDPLAGVSAESLELRGDGGALLVTANGLLVRAEDKRDLWHRLGRPVGACVDMETHPLVAGLRSRVDDIRCARVVSDAADDSMPGFLRAVRDDGSMPKRALVRGLLSRPSSIVDLVRLAARVRSASKLLAGWVEEEAKELEGRG